MHWRCNETPDSSERHPPIIRIGDELQVPAAPSPLNDIRKEARSPRVRQFSRSMVIFRNRIAEKTTG